MPKIAGSVMSFFIMIFCVCALNVYAAGSSAEVEDVDQVFYEKDFSGLIGMRGFSDALLEDHFALYRGYVKNSNKLMSKLRRMSVEGEAGTPEYAELKRRLGWEINGMRLHEYYFENLGGSGNIEIEGPLYNAIRQNFGSFEQWRQDFAATGSMRGIGWVILFRDRETNTLINAWINEHETGYLAGYDPILVMDVFEHAYMTDYRLDRPSYIEAFFKNVAWGAAETRFLSE